MTVEGNFDGGVQFSFLQGFEDVPQWFGYLGALQSGLI
tara:strand:- start:1322 stop:1435 length:114 start_codon:yes stop_codon:yes gene_type:complete